MQKRQLQVTCECGGETVSSLADKIAEGAAELGRLVNMQPSDFLAHSLYHTKPHAACESKGYINVADGPDDFEKVRCEGCNGTGRKIANN